MKKISIIGFGSIGYYVFKNLQDNNVNIDSIICKAGRENKALQSLGYKLETVNSLDEFKDPPYVILDCAGHSALIEYASKALLKGIHFITLSSGALCDDDISDQIKTSSEKGGGNFIVAPGAIGSLDILSSAKQGGIHEVKYIGRKPPKGWLGSRAEEIIDLKNLKNGSETHFSGTARDAAKLYPKNANVTATIALSGVGFDKTKVTLIADSSITTNIHELEIFGKFGTSRFSVSGFPLPENPRSSALAAMSMVAEVKKFLEIP